MIKINRKEYLRRYYEEHREEYRAADRRYYMAHREERNAASRRYCEAHREECNAASRRYYMAHRAEIAEKKDAYKSRPRGDKYAWIKRGRLQAGLTLQMLATAAGCSESHLSRLERGEGDASPEMQERIAHALTRLLAGI